MKKSMKKSMKKIILLFNLSLSTWGYAGTINRVDADVAASEITWVGYKFASNHVGTVALDSGFVEFEGNEPKVAEFVINLNKIVCTDLKDAQSNQKLVNHLKSQDFFEVSKYPTGKFVAKSFEKQTNKMNYRVKGELTLRNKTNPVEFVATLTPVKDKVSQVEAKMTLDRTLWGITYKSGKVFESIADSIIKDDMDIAFKVILKGLDTKTI